MDTGQHGELKDTPLSALHRELGARMVPFAGYDMPVQYPTGIRAEHEHTRTAAGLFDISHMGQIRISGRDPAGGLERLVTGEIQQLPLWRQRYTVLTNGQGGILDDLMITRLPDSYFLVVNAARKDFDFSYLRQNLEPDNELRLLTDRALLALQGPSAAAVLAALVPASAELPFLGAGSFSIAGIDCLVHRCGYTGEDGFEISVAAGDAEDLARIFLLDPLVRPVGLGARDSLRLEAGLCLYGHELDETTTPVEADLVWVIAGKYRTGEPVKALFPGADRILEQLKTGPARIRKGFRPEGRVPVREGTAIFDGEGLNAGIITSGGYGQTAGGPVAMGYVNPVSLSGGRYMVEIRNRSYQLEMVDLPFVRHRYYKKRVSD